MALLSNWALSALALSAWALAIGCLILGTRLARRRVHRAQLASRVRVPTERPGISILKPVKGAEAELEDCLRSCFELTYPRYELLFCAAEPDDPAIPIVESLMARYPRVRATLSIGAVEVGLNPKANNMARSYAQARYDWILISDSNVRLQPDVLESMAEEFDERVGVLTSVVVGVDPRSWAGRLEAVFLNAYYARWMLLAERASFPCVIGKAMMFRRSQADRFGGLRALSRYLAEDYMAGKAMALLGLRVKVSSRPAIQPIGRMSFGAFWSRHLRWGRIRRSQAPQAHTMEILVSAVPAGLIGSFAASAGFGLPFGLCFAVHMFAWGACDAFQIHALSGRYNWRDAVAWLARETLAAPLWAHAVAGRTVDWRGRKLKLGAGGLLMDDGAGRADVAAISPSRRSV